MPDVELSAINFPKLTHIEEPRLKLVDDARERFTSGALPQSVVLQQTLNADEMAFVDDLLARIERGSGTFEAAEAVARKRGISLSLRLTEDDLNDPELDAYVSQFGSSADLAALPLIGQIRQREDVLLQAIAQEFARFGTHVQDAFQATAKLNGVQTALESYRFIRALLYRDGWIDASRVFQDILPPDQGARFLGLEISGGAHRLLVSQLGDLTKRPGEDPATDSGEFTLPIKTILGFQPRRIAGKDTLSNHVFGLAIDIDANWNPHLKGEAARIVTRHSGVDFTQRLIRQGVAIEELYRKLSQAAQRFSKWLRESLNLEAKLREDLRKAQDKRAAAKTEQERNEAEREVSNAQKALANNMGMLLELDMLRQDPAIGEKVVAEWEKHGILTIPVALVRALKNHAFDWGAEWEGSKDLMHFELDPLKYISNLRMKARKP